jgi:outer membrane protein TolC
MFVNKTVAVLLTLCVVLSLLLLSCKSPAVSGSAQSWAEFPQRGEVANQKKPVKTPAEGPLKITVEEARLLTLDNNRALKVERFNPAIRRTYEETARSAFDPTMSAGVTDSHQKTEEGGSETESSTTSTEAGLSQFFPTGTEFGLGITNDRTQSSLGEEYSTRVGVSVTQSLLSGFGSGVNLASVRQAEIDTLSSQYELWGYTESLVAQVETTYWNYALAQRQVQIFTDSLKLAQQQLDETTERIKVGKLAETERAAAQAEVALRNQDLIDAKSNLAKTNLQLLRLVGEDLFSREVIIETKPTVPDVTLDDVESHVKLALRMRPDLNQSRLSLQRGELELIKTKNGLLPKLDLFITLGKSGYADSFNSSISEVSSSKSRDFSAGLSFEFPLGNRSAKAAHSRAFTTNEQAKEAITNLEQLIQVDVRSAYVEVLRAKEQVSASAATRSLQEVKLGTETEKFRVGKSTAFLVAQAQRDLVASQVSEIQAVVSYLKSLVELYRLEGTLLERCGISIPGREPSLDP